MAYIQYINYICTRLAPLSSRHTKYLSAHLVYMRFVVPEDNYNETFMTALTQRLILTVVHFRRVVSSPVPPWCQHLSSLLGTVSVGVWNRWTEELVIGNVASVLVIGIDHDTVCAGVVGNAIRNSTSCAGRRAAACNLFMSGNIIH